MKVLFALVLAIGFVFSFAAQAQQYWLSADIGQMYGTTYKFFQPGVEGYDRVSFTIAPSSRAPGYSFVLGETAFTNMSGVSSPTYTFHANLVKEEANGTFVFQGVRVIHGQPGAVGKAEIRISKPDEKRIGQIEMIMEKGGTIRRFYRVRPIN